MFKKHNNKTLVWILVIAWIIIISWSSSISGGSLKTDGVSSGQYNVISSVAHVFLYAVLTWLLFKALLGSGMKTGKALAVAFLISIIYGLIDEWHQYWVPGREVHLSDWLLDVAGSFVTLAFCRFKLKK